MAKTNLLPLIAVAGGMFLLMRSGGGSIEKGLDHAEETAEGLARKIRHAVVHGDLLENSHNFHPKEPGDTLKVTGAPADWSYYAAEDPAEEPRLDLYHDKGSQTLYITSLVPGDKFGEVSFSGLDMGARIMGVPPGAGDDFKYHEDLVRVASAS